MLSTDQGCNQGMSKGRVLKIVFRTYILLVYSRCSLMKRERVIFFKDINSFNEREVYEHPLIDNLKICSLCNNSQL